LLVTVLLLILLPSLQLYPLSLHDALPIFSNLDDFSLEEVARFDDAGPMWRHNNFSQGEHVGTHIDAPIHWISGKDGKDVSEIEPDRKSTRLNSSHVSISYAVFCL